jgi:hypothetical protein
MQRPSYPRSWQERSGQVNARPLDDDNAFVPKGHTVVNRPHPRGSKFLTPPDSIMIVTKRKGFGTVGNKESVKLPKISADLLLDVFTPNMFYRYKVNIFYKPKAI